MVIKLRRMAPLSTVLSTSKNLYNNLIDTRLRVSRPEHGHLPQVWDAAKLESVKSFRTPYSVESASYCAERGRFAAGGDDMWVHLYDFATGEELEVNRGETPFVA